MAERPVMAAPVPRGQAGWWTAASTVLLVMVWVLMSCSRSVDDPGEGGQAACPVTVPGTTPFIPAAQVPDGPPTSYAAVWYGTPDLWTMVRHQGEVWTGLPVQSDGSLTQKIFWWVEGSFVSQEPQPDIAVSAERLDAPAPTFRAEPGNLGGHVDLGVFTVVGLEIPEPGCWRITAEYMNTSLSYVAWVAGERR